MRDLGPYGLEPELLGPAKIITDPVHGDVRLTELERRLVDSQPFQRLRRVKQLGSTHLVYPGATHTRFSHSLGAVVAAQMLFDIVLEQRDEPRAKGDLFGEWRTEHQTEFEKRVAEAIVLTRLGALLHDFCHIPFGHSVEDELQLLDQHDANEERFNELWGQIDDQTREAIQSGQSLVGNSLLDDLKPIILSDLHKPEASDEEDPGVTESLSYPFVQDIVGNTISADLMDYLTRDHLFTGLPAAVGHRFLDSFYVSPMSDPLKPGRMVLRVVKRDRERKDTLTELLKFLRYRYELSERALTHHAKLAADAMVGKLLQLFSDALWVDRLEEQVAENPKLAHDLENVSRKDIDALRQKAKRRLRKSGLDKISTAAKEDLESVLLEYGDDGLLEHLRARGLARSEGDSRWAGVHDLADSLLCRRLFKPLARVSDRSHAKRLWEDYGKNPDERRQIEQAAARFAGIKPAWHAVMWIPPERMRLKSALVLVDDEVLIETMLSREGSPRGQDRGSDIYKAHRDLWALEVFVHPDVRADKAACEGLLGAIAAQLHLRNWADENAATLPADVARREAAKQLELSRAEEDELKGLVPSFYDGSVALTRDTGPTRAEMTDEFVLAWQSKEDAPDADGEEAAPAQEPGPEIDQDGNGSQQRLT